MISAKQAARLNVAQALHDARNKLLDIRSSIAFDSGASAESRQRPEYLVILEEAVERIDRLFGFVIPNE